MTDFVPIRFRLEDSPFPGVERLGGKPFDPGALKRDLDWCRAISDGQRRTADLLRPCCDEIGSCPICGDGAHSVFTTIYGYPYLECGSCGHIYCSRVPNEAKRKLLYSGTDSLSSIQETVYLDEAIYRKRVRAIAAPKVAYVASVVGGGGLWLDIGSGAGEILQAARDAGFRVRGVESDRLEADFSRRNGFDVVEAFVTEENAGALCGDADLVSLINVLEHVPSPGKLLAALVDSAGPQARFVLELPRHPSISSLVSLAYPDMAYRHIYPPDHLHVFSERSIRAMIHDLPLRVVSIWNFGQDIHELLQAVLAGSGLPSTPFTDGIRASASGIQVACDAAGLSDTILLICEKQGR